MGTSSLWTKENYMSAAEIKKQIAAEGSLEPAHKGRGDGPARLFRITGKDGSGMLGFISPISHEFCDRCNRLRLTSEGRLRSCLLHDDEVNLKNVLRENGSDEDIRNALLTAIRNKPKGHQMAERLRESGSDCHGRMSRIGG